MQAFYQAWLLAWHTADLEEIQERQWKRIAFACRYGRGAAFVFQLDTGQLDSFCQAVNTLVEEESRQGS